MTAVAFIESYFDAERAEALLFCSVGAVAMVIALLCWRQSPFLRGMAWPLLIVAAIQLTVGITVYRRSPHDIARVMQIVQAEPARIGTEEIPRMTTVMRNFLYYRYFEIALCLTGLALLAVTRGQWQGVGAGLLLQASLMLGLDYFAEARGHTYLMALRALAAPSVGQ